MSILMKDIAPKMAQEKAKNGTGPRGFPFYHMPTGSTTTVRILEDKDPENSLPWAQQDIIKLPFAGLINSDHASDNEVTVSWTALSTWGINDPITQDIKPLWNTNKDLARIYYRRPHYWFSILLLNVPFAEKDAPASPVRPIRMTKQLFDPIHQFLTDPEVGEYAPWDQDHGRDFKIAKTTQGQFANYSTSGFSFRERALTADERKLIETHGLIDIASLPGTKPDQAAIDLIMDLYRDSRDGRPFDNAKYGHVFKAFEKGDRTATNGTGNGNGAVAPTESKMAANADLVTKLRNKTIAAMQQA